MRQFRLTLLAVLLLVGLVAAQQPPAQPSTTTVAQTGVTFRAEANFVEVAAIVTDGTGSFVRGLTLDDFEVYEGGVLQKPSAFSLIDVPVEKPFVPVNATAPIESNVRASVGAFEGRIYLLVLDDLHTNMTRSAAVRDGAGRFIEEYLGVNDLAAVVYTSGRPEMGQELTNSRRLLRAAIDRFIGRKLPSAGAEKLAIHAKNLSVGVAETEQSDGSMPNRTPEGLDRARDTKDPFDAERGLNAKRALQAVENTANWLADVQGRRKALLLFSEGIDYDIYEPFNRSFASLLVAESREAIAAAQRANVTVYGIDPRGLNAFGEMIDINNLSNYPQLEYGTFRGALNELLLAQESLMALSEQTGGIAVVNSGDVVGGLGRIVLDNSRYYLLGYYSDASKWSDKFLKIDVKMKRPGLDVRARKGFLPPNSRALARAREAEVKTGTSAALKAALSKPLPLGDLPTRGFAVSFRGSGTNGSVLLAVEMDGRSLKFEEKGGRFNESIELSIVAADQRGKVQGGDRQTFNLNLMPETHQRVSRTGVRLLSRLDLPPGRYQIRIGAHESTGGTVATVPLDVEIPEYRKLPFTMSGVVVSASSAESLVTPNPDVELRDVFPLPPVATRAFSSSDTLVWFAEIYDSASTAAHGVTFTSTVQDANTGRTVFETQDRQLVGAAKTQQALAVKAEFPLKDLSPGKYVLSIQAAATVGGHSARRDVLFEVTAPTGR